MRKCWLILREAITCLVALTLGCRPSKAFMVGPQIFSHTAFGVTPVKEGKAKMVADIRPTSGLVAGTRIVH